MGVVKQPGVVTTTSIRVLAVSKHPSHARPGLPLGSEGAGKTGSLPAPWPPREKCTGQEPQIRLRHPGPPCAMPGDRLFCPRFRHNTLPHRTRHQHRDARDHMISPYAPRCSSACPHMSMILSESCGAIAVNGLRFRIMLHAATSTRPPHPAPHVRDDRETSLSIGNRTWLKEHEFWKGERGTFLREALDKGDRLESLQEKSRLSRRVPPWNWTVPPSADLPVVGWLSDVSGTNLNRWRRV